jgi:hypothetical protein
MKCLHAVLSGSLLSRSFPPLDLSCNSVLRLTQPFRPSSFRLPTRVTLNDAKRQAWFKDLADSTVPLHKLGKSVPHGAKGHDLLDLLHKYDVPIVRAVWFLRVFGAYETVRSQSHENCDIYLSSTSIGSFAQQILIQSDSL